MATIFDVNPNDLINKAAEALKSKEELKMPEWAMFVRTGRSKDRPPEDLDWWYFRSASVLRKVYLKGPIGVSKLRKVYGSRKNRGYRPEKFFPASGKIIRTILQQLEKAKLIEKKEKGVHKGKCITKQGKSFLDKIASGIYKNKKPAKKEQEHKKEPKAIKQTTKKVEDHKEEKKHLEKTKDKEQHQDQKINT